MKNNILLGSSFAASWTWAVAVLVGISILRNNGIIPFAIWFAANTAAIPFFGWLSFKMPGLWAQTRRIPMRVLMSVMLVFTIWINMTGIKTAGAYISIPDYWLIIIPVLAGVAVWVFTTRDGIRFSILSDRWQWALELGSVIVILVITLSQKGFSIDPGLKVGSYNTFKDWILGLWTIPLLLSNPFLDGTFWHRAKYANDMRPYWWGYGMFMVYLVSVAIIGLVGMPPLAEAILFFVIFFASFSTLDSCTAGLHLTGGKTPGIVAGAVAVLAWPLIAPLPLLDQWVAMFVWYPFLFAYMLVTYWLEKRGRIEPVDEKTLQARDAILEIVSRSEVSRS